MSTTQDIDFDQLKSMIDQFDLDKKIELIEILERETFDTRFKKLLAKLKTNEIDLEEITAEVEAVRAERYDARKQK